MTTRADLLAIKGAGVREGTATATGADLLAHKEGGAGVVEGGSGDHGASPRNKGRAGAELLSGQDGHCRC